MKAKTLTQSLSWFHTWSGLIFGWLLFAIFLTGTLAVFDKEIDGWMRPEVPQHDLTQAQAAQTALTYLQAHHPDASAWNIGLPTERSPALTISTGEQRRGQSTYLNPQTGQTVDVRESAGGAFFFRFHYTLNLPRSLGIWIVGLAAVAMLAALVSGIVIHKKFFKEFFTFRPAKGQRSWLDAHNVTGVLVLPFHFTIAYTGLVIFYLIYMPAAADALFDGDRDALNRAMRGVSGGQQTAQHVDREPASAHEGRKRQNEHPETPTPHGFPPLSLTSILNEAERQMGPLASLTVRSPGANDVQIEARPVLGNRIELTKGQSMLFNGTSGQVLRMPTESRLSVATQKVMSGLHFAQFGGYPMRWLYFICGLASCAMLATGVVLFTVKRRRNHAREGAIASVLYLAAERINVAVVAGLMLACIGFLWANRLLSIDLSARSGHEVQVFFLVWLSSLAHSIVRPWKAAWREQLGLAALLCSALPVFDCWAVPHEITGIHATLVVIGVGLGWCAYKMSARLSFGQTPADSPQIAEQG